ncbi:amino acid adenylation domain-containing protein, partial [Tumebacillus sp. DT12]
DASVWEFWAPLLSGAQLVMAEPGGHQDSGYLAAKIRKEHITVLQLVPTMLQMLLEEPTFAGCTSLRRVYCGGEALSVEVKEQFFETLPKASLHNLYGPTEACIDATVWDCEPGRSGRSVPIGRPIANTEIYLLDEALQPVPVGVPGELHIGGRGLARGYWQRPDLTEEKFIPHPLSEEPGARLYKTGDVARYLPNGAIEYLGRADHQVKLRGFRIELGEIENVLLSHPQVKEAVVTAHEVAANDIRLVAYLTAAVEADLDTSELRTHLQNELPDYMIPSAFVALDVLPLTPNGKVDRRALPAPDLSRETAHEYIAPRTPEEGTIAAIWADVMRLEQVGVLDDFFDLGGHSLIATQIMTRIRAAFHADIPLRLLFEAPTVAALAERIGSLREPSAPSEMMQIRAVGREEPLVLSFAQERLWFLEQLMPGASTYNLPAGVRLHGELDSEALERGYQEVIRRHEALRTAFVTVAGQPRQQVLPLDGLRLTRVDLRTLSPDQREKELRTYVEAEARRPFDLASDALIRGVLLQVAEEEHLLLVTMHHIVSDGWSMRVFIRELGTLYESFRTGSPSSLPELDIQYADFAVWQRERLQGAVLDEQIEYWKQQLGGSLPVLQVPTDRPRPAVQTYHGERRWAYWSKELLDSLQGVSSREGVTMYMTLLAAFKAFLYRYTGQSDLLVGTPIAGRTNQQVENLIGFFVNTLVMRSELAGDLQFDSLLQQIRETALEAYAHQDLPFEKLVEVLQPERDMSYSPLFQVLFTYEESALEDMQLSGLTMTPVEADIGAAKFDLSMTIIESESGLTASFQYNTDLFDGATIERMLGHFHHLLESIAADPAQPLAALSMWSESERSEVLSAWNDTRADYPQDAVLHELFEAQAARTPDAVAVSDDRASVTFRELNARSNQLARVLRERGVGADVAVGVLMERSVEMVVSLLGILKAGGAYVPLDPSYPVDRLTYVAEDTAFPVLLTQERLRGLLTGHTAELICLDSEWERIAGAETSNLGHQTEPEHLAYLIYTSGSTGKPKGVMIPHRAICNHMFWMLEAYPLTAEDNVLQKTPFGFDASVWEFWAPLLSGAQLVMAEPGGHQDSGYLAAKIRKENITVLQLVPTMLQMLLEEPTFAGCTSLRRVYCGGEALSVEVKEQFFETLPKASLHNLYGPTEACIDATVWDCEPGRSGRSVPIGRPIANTEIYLLDEALQPVPVGVPGELHIGGRGLARGYWQRPDLTEEKFIPHPLSEEPGARLYKTGDVARYLPNGAIEYLGRADHQVKIRGFRIELGEIENVLLSHPQVKEAVVTAHEVAAGDIRLVAYLTAAVEADLDAAELRTHLQNELPDYMIPSAFVALDVLPLTPNGKVDRRALPAPHFSEAEREHVAPRNEIETTVAAVFAEVLRLEQVGVHDHFFALGGHSLLATQAVSRLRTAFDTEIPLRWLFEAPRVEDLAARLGQSGQGQATAVPLIPVPRTERLPLSFAQERLWFFEQLQPGTAAYNIPGAFRLQGRLDLAALQQSFTRLIERHEPLRTTFTTLHGQPEQVIATDVPFDMPQIDLSLCEDEVRAEEVARLMREEAEAPFDLTTELPLRARVLRLAPEEHILLVTMHHIAADGWSLRVFVRELAHYYEAANQGRETALPDLPIQYADYASWQRTWLQGDALEAQLGYWRQQLSGELAVLQLPLDRKRPAVQTFRGGRASLEMPGELLQKLQELSQREGATLFMTLLAAFQTLLHRYTGQEDIAVGTPIAGRTREELEGLIGFFINTLVMRTAVDRDQNFRELLANVRQTALGAYAHQDVPFERLVDLHTGRDLSHSPLFQVMFDLQQDEPEELSLGGLTLAPLETESGTSKFDLTLSMRETADRLIATIQYNADLFDVTTIQRMLLHLNTLLDGIVAAPEQPISKLTLLTENERVQLNEWNQTSEEVEQPPVHRMVEARAMQTPDGLAVQSGAESMTYRELNDRADRVAAYLHGQGVGKGNLIAVCLERSPLQAVALLGVLKTGAAYLPLDPEYPADRLRFMIEDSRASVLLTDERHRSEMPAFDVPTVCLDSQWEHIEQTGQPQNDVADVTEADLAYVIYTSGSTGKPKGVLVPHRGLTNLAHWHRTSYSLTAADRTTLLAGPAFDASVWEIWPTLTAGASLHVPDEETRLIPERLRDWLIGQRITVSFLPTPLAESVLALAWPSAASLRYLLTGGDRLRVYPAPDLPFALVNHYGPTESSVVATAAFVPAVTDAPAAPSIGKPITNTEVYLLDASLQPVPVGVPGELHIGGAGLADGYLNRPELTAETFIPHPFRGEPGARLYKTGDLARWREDGSIEYLERLDHQVKIRGFRIELGEIEARLARLPQIRETVVLAREDEPGQKRLVAYVVAQAEAASDQAVRSWRSELQSELPDYMVPADFVLLDGLPLTPNGKIDRRALPAPDRTLQDDKSYLAPRTQTEELVANIWADLLHADRVSADDNFFDLGGHSLLATQAAARLREALGVEVPLRTLFEAPALPAFAARLDELKRSEQAVSMPPIRPADHEQFLPLSFAQERLWFFEQFKPGTATYNISMAFRLEGVLHQDALKQSVREIVRRHESLRTAFVTADGQPSQEVLPHVEPIFRTVDLSTLPSGEREEQTNRRIVEETNRPFDIEMPPLLRVYLIKQSAEEHIMILTMHHLITDGWSMNILFRELTSLYQSYSLGVPPSLPEFDIQYGDFAAWQREWLAGDVLDAQLVYWKGKLGRQFPVLQLPTDRPRPAVQTFRGANRNLTLTSEVAASLQALSRREGVTMFMTLLAAFNTLLFRHTGQPDLFVGTPVAGRTNQQVENLIGYFVNTLVMRSELAGDLPFNSLLHQTRETALEAYAHQDLPFEKLVEVLQPDRDMSYSPIFQVMFALQNAADDIPADALPGLTLTPLASELETAKFDLSMTFAEHDGAWIGTLQYNTDLFDGTTIERMLGHFHHLLESIAADPAQPLAALSMWSESERSEVLSAWNDTRADYPQDAVLHELFEAQAARTPDAVAVSDDRASVTFRELNARSNQLARVLRERGVGADVAVGVLMERSVEMVVSLLGILKAGGAYVPLDPSYPVDRLTYVAEDTAFPVLLTQERLRGLLTGHTAEMICLDSEWERFAGAETSNLGLQTEPEHLAYLIYTSGSTGKPKGVMIPHRAICNHMFWMLEAYPLTAEDNVLQKTPFGFDASVWEFWAPLLSGAQLVMAEPGGHQDSGYLAAKIRKANITVLQLVPTMLQMLLEEPAFAGCTSLRRVYCGGEALSVEVKEQFFETLPKASLHNLYGPTEACIDATVWDCEPGRGERSVPIGRPIANTEIYLLDEALQPVPVGVPGELHIGGRGLARGYWQRPDLTEEKFIPHPLSEEPGARLYKTGDVARYLPNGAIEYLGRADHQVKIRGFRIELGEIENVLLQHPQVKESVVIAREAAAGDVRLVAYITAREEVLTEVLDAADLQAHLRGQLPDYMIPSAFVALDALPLTPNGKVDRGALPEPAELREAGAGEYVAPRDELESELTQIWEEVLRVRPVGIRDNFFAIGGHSLLAVRLIAKVRERYACDLPLATLFQHGTVEELSRLIQADSQTGSASSLVRITRGLPGRTPLFFVHPVGGNVLAYSELARALGQEQPFYGLQAYGLNDDSEPLADMSDMAASYLREIREVQPEGPYLLGGWSLGGVVAYEMARQLREAGQEVAMLALLDSRAPIADFKDESLTEEREVLALLVDEIAGQFALDTSDLTSRLDTMDRADVWAALLTLAKASGSLPPGIDATHLERLYRVYRGNLLADYHYQAQPLAQPTVLFRAADEDSPYHRHDAANGWSALVTADLTVREVPGRHSSMLQTPHVGTLADTLAAYVKQTGVSSFTR